MLRQPWPGKAKPGFAKNDHVPSSLSQPIQETSDVEFQEWFVWGLKISKLNVNTVSREHEHMLLIRKSTFPLKSKIE